MIISDGRALDFAPQALGETTPSLSNGYYYATQGLNLSGLTASYGALYRAQPSIATVVDKVAASAARLTVKVWDNTPPNGRVLDTSSAFARLIANPCPEMSTFNFYRWTVATYEIYGEAFWYKIRNNTGQVVGLLPMHPTRTMVKRDENGDVVYTFTLGVASAGILTAPAGDVVAFLRYNPENLMRGMSRLEPLRSTLLNEDASRRATQSWWKRGARPSVVLKHPGELSQAAQDRLRASFDARHAGADNMGGTNVLEEGLDLQVIQLNAEEMQYIESRKLNMQEVCMVFDVPPPVVHILDHATFSNITEQMRSMYRDTMSPRLEDLESTIDRSLRSEFYAPGEREAEFDMSEVLRGDFESRVDKAMSGRQSGLWSGNTALEIVGLPKSDDPEMDKIYANAALVPLGSPQQRVSVTEDAAPDATIAAEASAAASGAASEAADAAQSAQSGKAVTVRAVMGKLALVKGNKPAIKEKMIDQHRTELGKFFDKQHAAVKAALGSKASGVFNPDEWNAELAAILEPLGIATSTAIGSAVADGLGGTYDPARLADWLRENATQSAENINADTGERLAEVLAERDDSGTDTMTPADKVGAFFAGVMVARAAQIATSRVGALSGLSSQVAAEQSDAKTKTWVVTSARPRPSHEAMDGETVPLGEPFSNGMQGPGDFSGGADEVAGCSCDLQFSKEG